MKYEEKQLRRKLKRRILIMAALILVPAAACFLTWGTAYYVRYNWATGSKDGLESNYVRPTYQNGGINLGYIESRNYNLAVGFDKSRITRDFGWTWGAENDPRYAYTNDTPHGPRFAGFEVYHHAERIGRKSGSSGKSVGYFIDPDKLRG